MSYLAPIHRAASIKHAVKARLLSPDEDCLVVAKSNVIEIYRQKDDAFVSIFSQPVLGKVTMLQPLRPASSKLDHLFIGTDRHMYFTVSWNAESRNLRTETKYVDQADKTSRDSQTMDRCIMDPMNRFLALLLYDGIVTVIPLSSKMKQKGVSPIDGLGDPIPTRISDLFVRSAVFLHPSETDKFQTQMAFLFEDSSQRVCLTVRALKYSAGTSGEPSVDLEENIQASRTDLELGASHVIPILAPPYGILVLAETSIAYFDNVLQNHTTEQLEEPTQFVAWAAIDDYRWIIGDEVGRLYLLMLLLENGRVTGWKMDCIGTSSKAYTLVYLDGGRVFVGSHQGDSELVEITAEGLQSLQRFQNIAPILDFTIMDMGNRSGESQANEYSSGQARIVTGSGVFGDGSLRSVRSGVGLEEEGILGEMENATDIFRLQSTRSREHDDILVVSFANETRIFTFGSEGEVEEQAGFKSLVLSDKTLAVVTASDGHLLQVTTSLIRLIDLENGMVISDWSDPAGQNITAASANDSELLVSVGGVKAVSFNTTNDITLLAEQTFEEGQISCIYVSDIHLGMGFIGFWQGAAIALVNMETLELVKKEVISDDSEAVPRCILLANLIPSTDAKSSTLLVSTANGEVVTFDFNREKLSFGSRKATILGTQQVDLKALPAQDEVSTVFATCEHPSLIFGSEGRLIYSAVTADNAVSVCPFNSELFPGAVAIATSSDIRIARIDTERRTHVQTMHVGELVRRIAYSPSLKAFGIGTIQRSISGNQEIIQSRFKLADEVLFQELDTYDLQEEELVESVIRAELYEEDDEPVERYIVGTAYMAENEREATSGRILVFAVTSERTLRLVTERRVKGACRALGTIDGKIVAALVKTVVIYALRSSHLENICSYRTSTAPIDLAIHAPTSQIAVADLMKSICIVTYRPSDPSRATPKLEETARHYQTAWSTAVARVDEDTWLEADAEGNLLVLYQDKHALSDDDKRRLRVTSELRLGEMVNRIRPISVAHSPSAPIIPRAFMATVEGGVHLFGIIAPAYRDLLLRLQVALADVVEYLGNVPFNGFRAFKSQVREAEEPERFVDGELIERFLDLDEQMQGEVVDALGEAGKAKGGLEGVRELVETLKRMH